MPDKTACADQGALFHQLNNQLGIVLANAELLESRLEGQEGNRARAAQIVGGAIDAIRTAQHIRTLLQPPPKQAARRPPTV